MKQPLRLDGAQEAIEALGKLPKTQSRTALRSVLRRAIKPIAADTKANAPYLWGDLEESLVIGTKLNRRQTALNRGDKATVEVHFGTSDPAGIAAEFGNSHQAAKPFFRAAWESGKHQALRSVSSDLGKSILRAAARLARRKK